LNCYNSGDEKLENKQNKKIQGSTTTGHGQSLKMNF
jgi:hypothetical protein